MLITSSQTQWLRLSVVCFLSSQQSETQKHSFSNQIKQIKATKSLILEAGTGEF